MGRLSVIIILLALMITSGCRIANVQTSQCYEKTPHRWVVCDKENGYTFWYPAWIEEGDWREQSTNIYTYDIESLCTPDISGASTTLGISSNAGKVIWGRVDRWDNMELEGWDFMNTENIVCRPSSPYIYVLCAERGGKTVVICLEQKTDNPDLAREIFETFRWNE